jgi:hypothetical protein
MLAFMACVCQDRIRHMDRSLQQADLDLVMDFFSIVRNALACPKPWSSVPPALARPDQIRTGAD